MSAIASSPLLPAEDQLTRSMTLLNSHGDITIMWTEEQEEKVIEMIKAKQKAGINFFLIEKIKFTPLYRRVAVKNPAKQLGDRQVRIDDEQVQQLIGSGYVELAKSGTSSFNIVKIVKEPETIAKSQTVATPRMVGG